MTDKARDRLIVALDVPGAEQARALIDTLQDSVGVYKIGLELLFSGGLSLASELAARGKRVFIDAKLLDIEATVERATASIARTGAEFLTVHALDCKTLDAAVRGRAGTKLKLLGVTVLTNLDRDDLKEQGIDRSPQELAVYRAMLAQEAGFDGVVASGQDAAVLRQALGPKMLIVTPGIRPEGAASNDQTRIATPARAIAAGADYLVVGRPITAAEDPREAAEAIVAEIESALSG
ncbi:orotidine-5'-phosphate decarboxylase [Methyloceanibacter sp.]|uniref:orotidine-5'-phosphate decarboxylase n=1 Tax=Methyloceanibacter sp. TaxID=1965321 RepID=UPI003D6C922F